MRLIDADKITYMWQQDRNGKFHDGVTLESIVNNMPTENVNDLIAKELEKIKKEIAESFSSSVCDCIYIIDNHIFELEGENNG